MAAVAVGRFHHHRIGPWKKRRGTQERRRGAAKIAAQHQRAGDRLMHVQGNE